MKGYDALMNLVLDDVQELQRGGFAVCKLLLSKLTSFIDDEGNESTRPLGLIVARGTLLVLISPVDGSEEIANPFAQMEE